MSVYTLLLAGLSGVLSTLSPCVLPLLPIVLASAAQAHRLGPLALAAGLTVSFTAVGLFVATVGLAIGLDASVLREVAAVLLLVFGLVLIVPKFYEIFANAASLLVGRAGGLSARVSGEGWSGQLAVGLVLGAVWTPCVGPTLGAAATLASTGQHLGVAAITMLAFGLGAALPLLILGSLSRPLLQRLRPGLGGVASGGKKLLGALLLVLGIGILTGLDHQLETLLLRLSPEWLTRLTTGV